jgi:hypothetical protein
MRAPVLVLALCLAGARIPAQEADSGFDLRATLTAQAIGSSELTEAPRSGAPMAPGARALVYPTLKFDEHWFVTGAVQMVTRPFYYSDLSTAGYGVEGNFLQGSLNYSRASEKGSLLVRAGVLSTAFGSFLLRYDDAANPLVDIPMEYGYYYAPVSFLGVAGAEMDATRGRWDGRVQFANSSPANPRSLLDHGQYGNWAGGAGFTLRQGFRIGFSGYRGPYLDRDYAYFHPGEESPRKLPAHALGVDGNWAHGHTTIYAEMQRFILPYTVIPTFRETAGYAEVKQALAPRWYVAGRYGLASTIYTARTSAIETSVGFRPNRYELLKIGYEFEHYSSGEDNDNIVGIQFITTLHKSAAWE